MRERVFIQRGKNPIILVAPHGCDDNHTASLTKETAKILDCYAVVNQGFERASHVDVDNDLADCNRVDHAKEPVVFDEFLKPIVKFQLEIWSKIVKLSRSKVINSKPFNNKQLVLYIHGAGNGVHKTVGEQVGIILGYGLGLKKDSLTCDEWVKNLFVYLYRLYSTDGECYEGQGGGKYAGRSSNNMNQYFHKHDGLGRKRTNCMQLELPWSTRNTASQTSLTANLLAVILKKHLQNTSYDYVPETKFI